MSRTAFHDGWTVGPNVSVFAEITGGATTVKPISIPHDAMLDMPRSADSPNGSSTGYFDGGAVSYRKTFTAPESWRERIVELEFHGVYRDAMVYLNGVLIGQRPYGYSAFRVRLDSAMRYGGENRIRVDARAHRDSRWYSGLGIHRGIDLIEMPLVHLVPNSLRATTPDIDAERAVVEIEARIGNESLGTASPTLRTRILDGSGAVAASAETLVTARKGHEATARQRVYVADPRLWSVDSPVLYNVEIELVHDGVSDTAVAPLGIRRLQLDPQNGLRINGEQVKLRGACIHHDNGILGTVSLPEAEERRVRILKEAGFNAIRSSHNPASPAMLDACDRLGMLVIDEAFDMWTEGKQPFDYSTSFSEWWERDVEAMVDKCANHPSVIMYSIGNEILDAGKPLGAAIGRAIAEKVRALDPTRFTTNGVSALVATLSELLPELQRELDGIPGGINDINGEGKRILDRLAFSGEVTDMVAESHSIVDIVGHNYAAWRYEAEQEKYPNRVVVGTETHAEDIDTNWPLVEKNAHVIGDFTWTGWDYLGESGLGVVSRSVDGRPWSADAYPALTAYCADIDLTGTRRPQSYYREIVFGRRRAPYIAVRHPLAAGETPIGLEWAWEDAIASWSWRVDAGTQLAVDVYSDADEVELFLNDRSLGVQRIGTARARSTSFAVPFERGELRAVALRDGAVGEEFKLRSAGETVAVRIREEQSPGQHRFLAIDLVDATGLVTPFDDRRVSVSVSREGELVALGTARPATEESYRADTCTTFQGRAQAIVRIIDPGARVSVTADGLDPVHLTIDES